MQIASGGVHLMHVMTASSGGKLRLHYELRRINMWKDFLFDLPLFGVASKNRTQTTREKKYRKTNLNFIKS